MPHYLGKEVERVRLSEEAQNLNSRISTLEQDSNTAHAQHQSEIETYKTQVESLQQQHNEDNLTIAEMQGQIAHCADEIVSLKTQIEQLTEDLSKANENLQKHKDLNTSLLVESNKAHHSLMLKNAMLLSMIGNEPASTDAATQQQPQQAQPMGDASEQPVGRSGRERTASSGSRDEPPSSDQEPALFPGTPDSHAQIGVSTAQSPPSATVQSSSGSTSEMDNIIEVPRNITQIFENARKMGIPAKYVYLGYDLINDGDDVPAKITSMDDLEAADQADETVLYEIAQTYGGENNAVKTPMQKLSIETVWANACQLELFLCVRGVKHWMALPIKSFAKSSVPLKAYLFNPEKVTHYSHLV